MRKLVYIALLLALCLACTDRQAARRLDRAQSLADSLPAEARGILDSLRPQLSGLSRSQLMRYHLTRIQTDNLLDSTLHEDSLMRQVAEYYDDHGTANERMLAYYLLGRTYSDMGEAPQALQAFHDAIDRADTTSSDCDYRRLMLIHGQAAQLFYYQDMPKHELLELSKAQKYGFLCNDTLSAYIYYSMQAGAYEMLNMYDSVIAVTIRAYRNLQDIRYPEFAAQQLASLIYAELRKRKYNDAGKHLEEYKNNSGFIDDKGNVMQGKELYYYFKGEYYIGIHKLDSAERFFRKILSIRKDFEGLHAGYDGLFHLYLEKNQADSLSKYSVLSSSYNDSLHNQTYTSELVKMQSLYDYTRNQQKAIRLEIESTSVKNHNRILLLSLILLTLISYLIIMHIRRVKNKKIRILKERYKTQLLLLKSAKKELGELLSQQSDYEQIVEKKCLLIDRLQEQLKEINSELWKYDMAEVEQKMFASNIYERFKELAESIQRPSFQEWKELRQLFSENLPQFYGILIVKHRISIDEYDMCMLYRLNFRQKDIANLLGLNQTSMPSKRNRLFEKITGRRDQNKEFIDFLMSIK